MSGIEELQQRVTAVEQQFGLAHEQRTKYSARLLSLMDAVETRLRERQAEIVRQVDELGQRAAEMTDLTARLERGERENEQLRGMLHSLLQAIEAGSRDVLSETMQTLDAKVASLIGETAQAPSETGPRQGIAPQAPATEAVADEAPATAADPVSAAEPAEDPADEVAMESGDPDPATADEPIADAPDVAAANEPVAETSDEAVADDALVDVPEAAPDIADEPAGTAGEDHADEPVDAGVPETLGESVAETAAEAPSDESVTLAAIMQRVSVLLDEDEGSVAPDETDAAARADPAPEADVADAQAQSKQAAGNG